MTTANDRVFVKKLDVSSRKDVAEVCEAARQKFGMVHILINNAGIVQGKSFMEMNEALVHKSMIINLESHFWLIREFLPAMKSADEGQIVSIASMAGLSGQPDMTDYCASKFGAVGLNESLRIELRKQGFKIKCTTITPYYINTGLFDGVKCSPIFPLLE